MDIEYLKLHPLTFKSEDGTMEARMSVCAECSGHPVVSVRGPAGEASTSEDTVESGVIYLLFLATKLLEDGRSYGLDFAHFVTTWATMATLPGGRLQ